MCRCVFHCLEIWKWQNREIEWIPSFGDNYNHVIHVCRRLLLSSGTLGELIGTEEYVCVWRRVDQMCDQMR